MKAYTTYEIPSKEMQGLLQSQKEKKEEREQKVSFKKIMARKFPNPQIDLNNQLHEPVTSNF